jgi:murein L,D-transpeptidase YcbB/YkuD
MKPHSLMRAACAYLLLSAAAVPSAAQEAPEAFAGPVQTEIAAAFAALPETESAAIRAFYAARGHAPYWTADDGARGEALIAALAAAPEHGMPAERYGAERLEPLLAARSAEDVAQVELAAMRAYLAFAGDLSAGVVVPSRADDEISISPERPDPAALLARLDAAAPDAVLAALEPRSAEYRALMAEKRRLEAAIATADAGGQVPSGPTLRQGDSGERVAALRIRLAELGHGAPADPGGEARFDAVLAAAVEAFQAERGLDSDGVVGARTLAALNAGPETRLRQVIVNLERLRWGDDAQPARRIHVNIPDFSVTLIEDGEVAYETRAVVGKAVETRTPEFMDTMTYFVVNPTWHIPDSIAARVYLPKLKRDPSVLTRSNMRLFTRSGTEIDPALVDFTQVTTGSFPFRIKQNPSTENALGRVKFMFPNQFAIYLHDTPARELFARGERAFSNGCVRLEDPLELAHLLLEGQVDDPVASFEGWLAAGSERYVTLERPIAVHLDYRTVWLDRAGKLRYREDISGRDARVFSALERAGVTVPAAQG